MQAHLDSDPKLTTTEWQAVSIAIKDAAGFGCAGAPKTGPIGRLYTALTGNQPPRPLADPRLEAIRRFGCATRRRLTGPEHADALRRVGFNDRQVAALGLLFA
ncbi:hypothetical protein [Sphingomonas sp. ID0503]|uniref:hypothetical protein n=1 Tax=Sphingomonas sp. ID0503 TaxID=3399691 RepID=UPI003AFB17D0